MSAPSRPRIAELGREIDALQTRIYRLSSNSRQLPRLANRLAAAAAEYRTQCDEWSAENAAFAARYARSNP